MLDDPNKNASLTPGEEKNGDPTGSQSPTLATGVSPQVQPEGEKSRTTEAVYPSQISDSFMPKRTQPTLQPDTIAIHLPGREQPLTFHNKDEIILGRSDSSGAGAPDIDLNADQGVMLGVSRQHALIRRTEDGYYIRDLGSTNGTALNGTRLVSGQPHRLQSGDQVRLGQLGIYVYFSFSSKKSIDTILLADSSLGHTDKLREGLTIPYLQEKIAPYLDALSNIQHVLDTLQKQTPKVTIRGISPHVNGRWIEVSIQGTGQIIQAIRTTIAPLRATRRVTDPKNNSQAESDFSHEINVARAILTSVDPTLPETSLNAAVKQIVPHIVFVVNSDMEMINPTNG